MATPEENQMEMMLEGGGLNEQGGTVDPVSGNEVPDGATQAGVRDDIPAMLSEGEYIMNEASTRYHGVGKLNAMQEEAKQGYNQMEQDGLMGQEVDQTEEALPFGMADLSVSDEEGRELMMAEGGDVSTVRKLNTSLDDNVGTNPPTERRPQPTFGDSMGGGGGFTFKMYTHPDGRNMMVPYMNGIPMFNIPEGFVLTDPNAPVETPNPVTDPTVIPLEIAKPVEFEGGPDEEDKRGIQTKTAVRAASIASGEIQPTALESWFTNTSFYDKLATRGLKSAGKTPMNSKKERARQYAMLAVENEMNFLTTGTPEYNELADVLANTREYTTNNKNEPIPTDMHPSRKTTINPNSPFYNKTPTVATPTVSSPKVDKAAADKRNDALQKEIESANLNKDVYNLSDPTVMGGAIANAVAAEGKPATGVNVGKSPAPDGSMGYTGGPDGYAGEGGPDGYSGGDANSGGDFSGGNFGGSFGYFNQGGLAGKKPKKKMKTYKKGGLATSKK